MIHDLAKFIFYYKELEYGLDMINYSYSTFDSIENITYISNIIQHFLNASDIKINDKIKKNLELVKLISDIRIKNCSNVIQCFLNASDIKINNKINHNLQLIKKENTLFLKNIGTNHLKLNILYKTAKSDTNILNYCDHIYNISDILNLNDNNIQNDRKRLKYWFLYIIENLYYICMFISYIIISLLRIPFIIFSELISTLL